MAQPTSPSAIYSDDTEEQPKMADVAQAAAAVSGIHFSGTSQSAKASPQRGPAGPSLPGINSRSHSNSGWL